MVLRLADLPRLREQALEVCQDLVALKVRTILAIVGIAVGVTAVIALLHVSYTARAAALSQFEGLGLDILMAAPQSDANGNPPILPATTASSILLQVQGVDEVATLAFHNGAIRYGRDQVYGMVVAGSDAIYSIADARISVGRTTSDFDRAAPYAVAGADLARALGAGGDAPLIGSPISIDGNVVFTLVGILQKAPASMMLNLDLNNSLVIPAEAVWRLRTAESVDSIAIRVQQGVSAIVTAAAVEMALGGQMSAGTVQVTGAAQLLASVDEQMRIYSLLLVGIGVVAALVGGVGVMNVMLFSVIERRQEIGLRRSLGASRSDIRFTFLLESVCLSIVGSAIGIGLGYSAGWGFSQFSGTAFSPSPLAVPLGLLMALSVGLIFGMIPAIRASRMNPVEALRSET